MPPLRHAHPARSVHEPVCLHMPALPATAAERPVVTVGWPARGSGPPESGPWGPGSRRRSRVGAETESTGSAAVVRLTAWVEGRVQGVGFRWWVRANALELGLVGYAENLADGRVKVVAEGDGDGCQELLRRLDGDVAASWPRRPGKVGLVTHRWAAAEGGISGFHER